MVVTGGGDGGDDRYREKEEAQRLAANALCRRRLNKGPIFFFYSKLSSKLRSIIEYHFKRNGEEKVRRQPPVLR